MTTHRHKQLNQLPRHYFAAELTRAHIALQFHRNQSHPSDDRLIRALDNGCFRDVNITSQDIRNMRDIHGPCTSCFEDKATMPQPEKTRTLTFAPGQLLHADLKQYDLLTIGGNKQALIVADDYTNFVYVSNIKSKSSANVFNGLRSAIFFFNKYRHVVQAVQVDPEKTLLSCRNDLGSIGVRLDDVIAT
jgi:hypothetical protein